MDFQHDVRQDHIYLRLSEHISVTVKTIEKLAEIQKRLTGIRGKYYRDRKHPVFPSECFTKTINFVGRNAHNSWDALQKELKFYLANEPAMNDGLIDEPSDVEPSDEEDIIETMMAQLEPPIPSTSKENSPKRKHQCCCKYQKSSKKSKIDDYY